MNSKIYDEVQKAPAVLIGRRLIYIRKNIIYLILQRKCVYLLALDIQFFLMEKQ